MEQIGKYQLKKVLGQGASGKVYLALDTFSGIDVALKVLDPRVIKNSHLDQTNMLQFMNEASLAGKLLHPHIASILEASLTGGSGYIALEFVPGGDLTQYTQLGKLVSQEDAIEIAFKCCGALDYAFRQGIVHRDIKPANILVVSGTNIKIGDFGAAYLYKATETQQATVGSPLYMSPEQVQGVTLNFHSDMFSMGIVLYQLFTNKLPFGGATLDELFSNIIQATPAAPSSIRQGLNPDIDRILLRMLAKKDEDRYPSWAELALEIAAVGQLSVYKSEIPDSEKLAALKRVRMLDQLDEAELWELVHIGKWMRFPPRTVLVREGEPGRSLFFVGKGQVKVTKQGRLLNLLNAGECVGEMSYAKDGEIPRQATVETLEDVLLVEYVKEDVDQVSLRCRYHFSMALTNSLIDRLVLADARIIQAG